MNLPEEVYCKMIMPFKDYLSISLKVVKKEIEQFHYRLKISDKIKK